MLVLVGSGGIGEISGDMDEFEISKPVNTNPLQNSKVTAAPYISLENPEFKIVDNVRSTGDSFFIFRFLS